MELQCKDQQRHFPHDLITQNILPGLPTKSLVRFKSVSKQWYSTISSPHFAFTHFNFPHSSPPESLLIKTLNKFQFLSYENGVINLGNMEVDFDVGDENFVLVGSCNGLVCLGSTTSCLFIIWNPITREFRRYSDSEILDFSTKRCNLIWGFGYVSAIDDYKIVRICQKVSVSVHVFSIRFDKWTRIDNDIFPDNFPDLKSTDRLRRPGLLINETLYWMGSYMYDGLPRKIFAFDLALDLIHTYTHLGLTTPLTTTGNIGEIHGDEFLGDDFLCVVKGRLSKYGTFGMNDDGVISILEHVGEKEQIFLPTDLDRRFSCNYLIGFNGSDKFFTQYYDDHTPHLGIIDPSLRPIKYVPLMIFEETWIIEIVSYSPSFIPPPSITRTPKFEGSNN